MSSSSINGVDILVLSVCSFVGNVGVSLTGFGMAIVFLFALQIFVITGLFASDEFKFAIFVQAIALMAAQPLLLYKANILKNASRRMLRYFIPITIVATPLGQVTGDRVSTEIVELVGGILVSFVALFELYQKRQLFVSWLTAAVTCGGSASRPTEPVEEKEQTDDPQEITETDTTTTEADPTSAEVPSSSEPSSPLTTINDSAQMNRLSINSGDKNEHDTDEALSLSARFWTLCAGATSGYLGGLCGIRGPPIIVYFLHPPTGVVFNKQSQRATGACITATNVGMRMVYYLVDTLAFGKDNNLRKDDWDLYLAVIGSSVLGVVVGSFLFERMKDNRETIRGILTLFLLLCGASLLISSFGNLGTILKTSGCYRRWQGNGKSAIGSRLQSSRGTRYKLSFSSTP